MVTFFLPEAHWAILIVNPSSDSFQSSDAFPGQSDCAVGDQKHNYARGAI